MERMVWVAAIEVMVLLCFAYEGYGLDLYVRLTSANGVQARYHVGYQPSAERLDECIARICNVINSPCSDDAFLQLSAQLRELHYEELKTTSSESNHSSEDPTKDVYFFLHIPKTAGTSMVGYFQVESGCSESYVASSSKGSFHCPGLTFLYDKAFQHASSWAQEVQLMPTLLQKQLMLALSERNMYYAEISAKQGKTLLVGHYEMPHFMRLFGERKKAMTLLREPVARIKSLYAYWQRMAESGFPGDTLQSQGIKEILQQPLVDVYKRYGGSSETASLGHYTARVFFNGMTRMFISVRRASTELDFVAGRTRADCDNVDECDYKRYLREAIDVIDTYFLAVGVQEAFVDSMLHFIAVTKFFKYSVERKNVTVKLLNDRNEVASPARELTELDEAIIWSYNRLDSVLFLRFARCFIDVKPIKAKYTRYAQLLRDAGLTTHIESTKV